MFLTAKNSKQQANASLGMAIAYYCQQMCTVSLPLTDSQDYDLIVDRGGALLRVRIKTAKYSRDGQFEVSLSMHGGNRKRNFISKLGSEFEYDILFVVTNDGCCYEIPRGSVAHIKRGMRLPSPSYQRFKVELAQAEHWRAPRTVNATS